MEYLTSAILSGLIYDGVRNGAIIGYNLLKSKLQAWIIDDNQINEMVELLKKAGINEDLAPHAIERKIDNNQQLVDLLKEIQMPLNSTSISQSSNIGHNIVGNGVINVGGITTNKENE